MSELLDAVDSLTKPERRPFKQDIMMGGRVVGQQSRTIELPPLLTRLAEAVTSSIGSGGRSSGSSPWTMNPLDSDALFEFGKITAAIGDWCRMVGVIQSRDAVVDLRRWHAAYLGKVDHSGDEFYTGQLRQWKGIINVKLDPARKFEIELPCPVCGKAKWTDAEGNEIPFPIVVEYRDYGTAEAIKPRAMCRACLIVWQGFGSIEELGDELKERHAEIADVS